MSITEHVNQNEGPIEDILNKNDLGDRQTSNSEPMTVIGHVGQKQSYETDFEDEAETSIKDVVFSSLAVLSFIAILFLIYYIYPS